jgi:hypothetical protein
MASNQRQPDYFYSPSPATLEEHMRKLYNHVVNLMERVHYEPSDLNTQWRDDGEDGHNGWVTIIKWPLNITEEPQP